jgi:hypothetical protein
MKKQVDYQSEIAAYIAAYEAANGRSFFGVLIADENGWIRCESRTASGWDPVRITELRKMTERLQKRVANQPAV